MHATIAEILLCAGVGAYIGFILGLRYGAILGYEHGKEVIEK